MARRDPFLLYPPIGSETAVRFVKGIGPKGAALLRTVGLHSSTARKASVVERAEKKLTARLGSQPTVEQISAETGLSSEEVEFARRAGIKTVQDLLQLYPRRHLDFSDVRSIREAGVGDEVTLIGEIKKVSNRRIPRRGGKPLTIVEVSIYDGTSYLPAVFFNQPWRAKQLEEGTLVALKGKLERRRGVRQMTNPMVDVVGDPGEVMTIVPVYPANAEVHTAWIRRAVAMALEQFGPVDDPVPPAIRSRLKLSERHVALRKYHFPSSMDEVYGARRRLVFDELFSLQLGLAYRKRRLDSKVLGIAHETQGSMIDRFMDSLPFEPTEAQRRAIKEVSSDIGRPAPMHRLIQGEVGSGKTLVAAWAAVACIQSGYQAVIMAPTEVLAQQHYVSLTQLVAGLPASGAFQQTETQLDLFAGMQVVLLTSSVSGKARQGAIDKIASGQAQLIIGTHALLEEEVSFARLGLAVVDEQHRFGVYQRLALREKAQGRMPDLLIMTATPIPRTLALTLYGDLDVSVLDELPKGRKPSTTMVVEPHMRAQAYELMRKQARAGHQGFVITPLVEESELVDAASAEVEAQRLAADVFPDLRVGKLHGRMRPAQKEAVMQEFRQGRIDVLISTTVVEVGVDVPNATVMIIENADRFGLSQLHQLRGRIGRGQDPSWCLLLTSVTAEAEEERRLARARLDAVASTNDGFELANKDLEIRGEGELFGVRQSGMPDLKLARLVRDAEMVNLARAEAFALIDADPDLKEHPLLRQEMQGRFADRLEWLFAS